jgi:hypothetical protein
MQGSHFHIFQFVCIYTTKDIMKSFVLTQEFMICMYIFLSCIVNEKMNGYHAINVVRKRKVE